MAITPMAWNSAAWSDLTGYRAAPVCEALRLALVERAEVVGEAVPLALSTAVDEGYMPRATWGQAVDTLIDALIPQYLDTSGAAPYTAWSEATILTAIGAGSRLRVTGAGYIFRAAWAMQVRAILDAMLTYRSPAEWIAPTWANRTLLLTDTWANAVSAFNALGWSRALNQGNACHFAWGAIGSDWVIIRQRESFDFAVPAAGGTYSLYVELVPYQGGGRTPVFEDNDYGYSEGWSLHDSGTLPPVVYSTWIGDFADATVTQPSPSDINGWQLRDAANSLALIVTPAFAYTT